ncbi:interferon-stimulated 20 kDa exonuclease-like 2 [Kryptolebias marmoratus]|uniref:Interferon stimulated exonuclease 20 like 2 n=1 Tax=Kryptolebias marmoratus TaxID=37003 RepID=A0A3Q3GFF9_KRYMA|nr:interferon-stimulated 20 kDa exonuclease-like 2 [Kryptolebias marmoratus]XP_017283975.1 interferon-stimulated 20 kDa exonuclease-like 2 [Kryptolebias marmoratus]
MSDIMIHVCTSDDTSQRSHPPGKEKRKRKPFHKKMQYLQAKGYLKGKQNSNFFKKDSRKDQNPHQNGAKTKHGPPPTATQNKSLPHLPTTASAFHSNSRPSTSSHNLPSMTFTVINKGGHEKPKESVSTQASATGPSPSVSGSHKPTPASVGNPTKYLAIDCEMVGTGPKGSISQLARCSIISYDGDVVYDKFIKPSMPITDYRTKWSGIRPRDLLKATPFSEARKEILRLLMGKVVVGHAIHNDFKALSYTHPSVLTRDTSRIPLLNLKAGFGEKECASLKRLTKAIFNRDIQVGKKGHSSVEDAKATMELYKVVEEEWERTLLSKSMAT